MKLKKLGVEVTAKAVFGRLPDYRYWYADAFANFGAAGIPVFPGFKINGLGGGAYSHMKLAGKSTASTGIVSLARATKALLSMASWSKAANWLKPACIAPGCAYKLA